MINNFFSNETFRISAVIMFKIVLCIILTGAIGYNREKKGMVVGIRTARYGWTCWFVNSNNIIRILSY